MPQPRALITGASRGIGAAIAHSLAPTHQLILAGRTSQQLLHVADFYKATIWPLDLSNPDQIHSTIPDLDYLDVLIHAAGTLIPGDFTHSHLNEWQQTFAVNVFSAIELTHSLLPSLRQACGQVIFINSTAGLTISPTMAAYSASKFALRAAADALRISEPQLRITTVYPGRTNTDMQRQLVQSENRSYNPKEFIQPDTIAAAITHLIHTPHDGYIPEITIRPHQPNNA